MRDSAWRSRCTASGILVPDVEKRTMGTDRVGGNRHPFQHAEGIRFHDHAIHERTGIAFVAVADKKFVSRRPADLLHFAAVG